MVDPLSEIVSLLNPQVAFSKMVQGAGAWRITRENTGEPFYCVVISGECALTLDNDQPRHLTAGDFVLIPEAFDFTFSSTAPVAGDDIHSLPEAISAGRFRLGDKEQAANVQLLVGHCRFDSLDAKILVSLLPKLVHIRNATRLTSLVEMLIEESLARPPGYVQVVRHLLQVLLIEAFRTKINTPAVPGLLVGLADKRIAEAIRTMHQDISQTKTVAQLAKVAALSRSAFFYRFRQTVGITPMEYQVAWRMTIAKDLLKTQLYSMVQIADRVGYKSASAFSLAFTNYTGISPSKFKNMGAQQL
ncbi:AraC family transcriptional regulator [Rheinheimera sp.]|uniref:AraC family transcriptional regulator n=1 Tax=Rheinheimera sp. TaxID=1869214 RepID=UPI0027329773|nr:AraC family transcriptional regulator [Rheinheimera sp.]MDP2716497.1 AraC family transcriptional regulator [Rheinheimera sp.]